MGGEYTIRTLEEADIPQALQLAWDTFMIFEAPDTSPEGIAELKRYLEREAALARHASGEEVMWGAFCVEELVGMCAFRVPPHISLLFVDAGYHRLGIAQQLMDTALQHAQDLGAKSVTVHSGLYAADVYHRFGFTDTGAQTMENGLKFIPMERQV